MAAEQLGEGWTQHVTAACVLRDFAILASDRFEEHVNDLARELTPAPLERPRGADHRRHRAAQLVRDERDEVRAEGREPPQLVHRAALRLVGVDVLRGRGDENRGGTIPIRP